MRLKSRSEAESHIIRNITNIEILKNKDQFRKDIPKCNRFYQI